MIGYGPEINHFVVELTYNYGKKTYKKGNDFVSLTIKSREALQRAKELNWPILDNNILEAPGGYRFRILDEEQPSDSDPVQKVTLACSNLIKSISFWNTLLGLAIYDKSDKTAVLGFGESQAKLELVEIGTPINRGEAFGRIAFSCPYNQQEDLNKKVTEHKATIIHPLTILETPGKASVRVLILADPDNHEICFVDDESFRKLSQVDPKGDELLENFIKNDRS
ncbi:hypothetical protein WA026_016104 [Henosepilachna vigintioctopunctata]